MQTYTLNTVTFGTASAPYLAIRILFRLAEDEKQSHPISASILQRDFYVDDLLTGANTVEEALNLRNDLSQLLAKGGFSLRKWASNEPKLVENSVDDSQQGLMTLDCSDTIKTLGLHWNPKTDSIHISVKSQFYSNCTSKRSIFSAIAKLFDPLGLIGPVVVVAKLLIQDLWKIKLSWDEDVPSKFLQGWFEYTYQVPLLNHVQFNRCITIKDNVNFQLHGFSDSSERAYGARLYPRSVNTEGLAYSFLICSKSRVAPIRAVSLPRLELCAALLLAKLYTDIKDTLNIEFSETCFWTDSTITLHWVNTPSHILKTFVASRVAVIQSLTHAGDWRHVPSKENPADLLSRGLTPQQFLDNDFWKHGPHWLREQEVTWPQGQSLTGEPLEKRSDVTVKMFKLTIAGHNLLEKYSSFDTLIRVMAFCMRFINNCKNKNKPENTSSLSVAEIESSKKKILQLLQCLAFARDFKNLFENKPLNLKSSLLCSNPFLDDGIIRVGGRLELAQIPEDKKYHIVLPKNHHITKLIIRKEHVRKMHAGSQATLYAIHEEFWPIGGRNIVRLVICQCVSCFRAKPRGSTPPMGNHPESGICQNRPFLNTGIDYCGPSFIKEKRHRNLKRIKAYVYVFVCFATKAVHLELVCDLTTEAFLGALKRFCAHRGKPNNIYSDNATNFVGGHKEIKELHTFFLSACKDQLTRRQMTNEGISWHFIPPRCPHFGGLWGASVKSFKQHLIKTVGNTLLTYDQLETYVVEIEAILNSRPILPLSNDPNDLLPLTPSHFLIGSSLSTIPQANLEKIPTGRLSAWQHVQMLRQLFWTRWNREFLHQLTTRSKWRNNPTEEQVKVGTLVLLKEDNLPPLSWKLGRIVEVHPGRDSVVQVVKLRTNSGTYTRAVTQLCPLLIF